MSGTGAAGGLPLGGEHWECHRRLIDEQSATAPWPCTRPAEWICYGDVVPGAAPPGGCGWDCERFAFQRADRTVYRCQRPEGPADLPPDAFPPDDCDCGQLGRCAYCERGSGVGGTLCLVGALPPPVVDTPNGRPDCEPGATYWCDDAFEDGWGTVTCREDGSWPTEQRSGRSVVACGGGRIGARAQTVCACYHFYIDRRCCERSDCRVPSEDLEQHCPRIGSAPCAPCLPFGPDSCAPGLVCVVNEVNEGFCATRCDDGRTCSMGTRCVALQWRDAVYRACVPDNDSCYW